MLKCTFSFIVARAVSRLDSDLDSAGQTHTQIQCQISCNEFQMWVSDAVLHVGPHVASRHVKASDPLIVSPAQVSGSCEAWAS